MADVIYANHMEPQVFNTQQQSARPPMEPGSSGQNTYVSEGGMQTASNEGFYLDFVQTSAGNAAAESHKPELTETTNSVKNMEKQTSKLSRDVVRQKKCLILIAITFAALLGVGLTTVYMLSKNQETQPIGEVGVGNKSLATLVQYIDEQRKYITQLELHFREGEVTSTNKRLQEQGISEDDLKKVNNTALEQLQMASNDLKSAQVYLIKDVVMKAGENYITVDGKLFWTGSAPELTYDVAYSVCAKYWSTIAQIKNRREYDAVMSMFSAKSGYITVRIGSKINFMTEQTSPTDEFTTTDNGEPTTSWEYDEYDYGKDVVYLVDSDLMNEGGGMITPSLQTDKVICQL
ncbi:uncharacterized protein LOC144422086 [Styela clava]